MQEYELLSKHTTFEIGGPARYFIEVRSLKELKDAIYFSKYNKVPFFIFSGGSNVLFDDKGYNGVVIKIQIEELDILDRKVKAGAGVSLRKFLDFIFCNELSGAENLYGIPGSVGGAVRGNAGAFGTEIKDIVESIEVFDTNTEEIYTIENRKLNFGYRTSLIKENENLVVLYAYFKLKKGDKNSSLKKAREILAEREKRHIQSVKSAGSFFKNPVAPDNVKELFEKEKNTKSRGGRVPAGWIIEKLGLKGYTKGNAQISPMHPNYFVNLGGATFKDVIFLKNLVQKNAKEKFNIDLEPEVKIVYQTS